MNLIYLSLGSNLGHRQQHLDEALKLIQSRIGGVEHISPYYDSEPWGFSSENSFCNCCVSLRSSIDPLPLLKLLLEIENEMGRFRSGKGYSDRVIDIDMLSYGDIRMDHKRLTLPHPSMGDRRFVLVPLADIAPGYRHPVTGLSISELLQQCNDQTVVRPLS